MRRTGLKTSSGIATPGESCQSKEGDSNPLLLSPPKQGTHMPFLLQTSWPNLAVSHLTGCHNFSVHMRQCSVNLK